jgi:hypothetical protein
MRKVLYGLLALPLLAGFASAETAKNTAPVKKPMQLSEKQMDKVSAGWRLREIDTSNTSWTEILVYQNPNTIPAVGTGTTPAAGSCPNCYLNMVSPALSIFSAMSPLSGAPPAP